MLIDFLNVLFTTPNGQNNLVSISLTLVSFEFFLKNLEIYVSKIKFS